MGAPAKTANRNLLTKVKKYAEKLGSTEKGCEKVGISQSTYYAQLRKAEAEDANGGTPVSARAAHAKYGRPVGKAAKMKVVTYDGAPQPTTAAVRSTGVSGKLALFVGNPDQVLAIFRKL